MTHNADYVFVYGTLRPGFNNPYARFLHQHGLYIAEGVAKGKLYDLGAYPGLIPDRASQARVHGSVYEISKNRAILAHLDAYEGIGNPATPHDEYRRVLVPVHCHHNTFICWTYEYAGSLEQARVIVSGRYSMNE